MTSPIQSLYSLITSQIAGTICELDFAESTAGSSFLTLKAGDYQVIVDWRQDRGFGVTAGRNGEYGEGPDETMPDLATAQQRIIWLLKHREITSPPTSNVARAVKQPASGGGSPLPETTGMGFGSGRRV